LQNQSV
jgi:hypothetical protein